MNWVVSCFYLKPEKFGKRVSSVKASPWSSQKIEFWNEIKIFKICCSENLSIEKNMLILQSEILLAGKIYYLFFEARLFLYFKSFLIFKERFAVRKRESLGNLIWAMKWSSKEVWRNGKLSWREATNWLVIGAVRFQYCG